MSKILQERVTLDEAALDGINTFPNGCNFRLLFDEQGIPWIEYGCYGVHINLVQGKERLLYNWFIRELENPSTKLTMMRKKLPQRIPLPISPETIMELLKRVPCKQCGAPFFKERI